MSKQAFLGRVARPFVAGVERYYPDPFVFLIVLTSLAFVLALALTPASPDAALQAWGDGLAGLLGFMAQIALTLLTAHALAHTDPVVHGLHKLARVPSSVRGCYAMVALIACLCSLLAWSFGLVAGALIARAVAHSANQRGLRVHYPLLVAAAYSGIAVWHMGYSGSAPLFVATPGHEMLAWIGVLPISETLFSSFNLMAIVATVTALVWVCTLLHPAQSEVQTAQGELIQGAEPEVAVEAGALGPKTFARRLDNNRVFTLILGLLLTAYLARYLVVYGAALNLNIVNWTFLALGLLLCRSAAHYVALILDAGRTVGAVFIQYPFYAGIMGLMSGTGLVQVMAAWFTAIATAQTLPFWAFLAGGLVNLFVPSGGGQWAVQGPVFLQAAAGLGVDPALIVMGVAYGDQWSNLIQPFWTIPLLAIAGLHMRHIMGYCFVLFLVSGVTLGGAILLAGYWHS